MTTKANENNYNASHIEIFEGISGVRKRINVYLADKGDGAVFVAFKEILDNACDEALSGYNNLVYVYIDTESQSVTVVDAGRGIPVDPHPQRKDKSALEVVLTEIHAGGKFSGNYGGKSGGLNGLGMKAVCAISSSLQAQVLKSGKVYNLELADGVVSSPLTYSKNNKDSIFSFCGIAKSGTSITYSIDPSTLPDCTGLVVPTYEDVYRTIEERSYLIPTCKFILQYDDNYSEFIHTNGILDLVKNIIPKGNRQIGKIFAHSETVNDINVDICLLYTDGYDFTYNAYCNCMRQTQGGTHVVGVKNGMVSVLKEVMKNNESLLSVKDKALDYVPDDYIDSVVLVISILHDDPVFHGQTKEKLMNNDVSTVVTNIVKTAFKNWLNDNPSQTKIAVNKVVSAAKSRIAANKARDTTRTANKQLTVSTSGAGRVAECRSNNYEETELFIVEGDSAGSGAKQTRNKQTQAILPLRGKPKNSWGIMDLSKILENSELNDLMYYSYNKDKDQPRYGKIIIASDADIDGKHISCLLIGFYYQFFKNLVADGRLYLAKPPLYKVVEGKKKQYLNEFSDLERYLTSKLADLEVVLHTEEDQYTIDYIRWILSNCTLILKAELMEAANKTSKQVHELCYAYQCCMLYGMKETTQELANDLYSLLEYLGYQAVNIIHHEYNNAIYSEHPNQSFKVSGLNNDNEFITIIVDTDLINSLNIFNNDLMLFAHRNELDFNVLQKIFLVSAGKVSAKSAFSNMVVYDFLIKLDNYMREGVTITRLKGLGEMNSDELEETVLNPETRKLIQLNLNDDEQTFMVLDELLGKDAECRRKHILEKELSLESLDLD